MKRVQLFTGDCVQEMELLRVENGENSIDAIVCDPPYGIRFMGKAWDGADIEKRMLRRLGSRAQPTLASGRPRRNPRKSRSEAAGSYDFRLPAQSAFQAWCKEWAEQAFHLLKPGGHMLVCGSPRTYHRLTCAIEDAGFEIRDSIMWLYGTGFPKSHDVSKAIDKAAGATRTQVLGAKPGHEDFVERTDAHSAGGRSDGWERPWRSDPAAVLRSHQALAPATETAMHWQGWGTALKPGHEPIVVARKPFTGTVAANVLEHGTGALNIDACRIGIGAGGSQGALTGRWPANVALDEDAADEIDVQSGTLKASRFFYCAKTSRKERNAGLEEFPDLPSLKLDPTSAMAHDGRRGSGVAANNHPTVKPLSLTRWLTRLVTPPNGVILDPFMGSGTTGCAAVLEGFRFVGIEREPEYTQIAEARIAHAMKQRIAHLQIGGR